MLINPVIESHAEATVDDWEGCLSIPDLRGKVPRWTSLRLTALDHCRPTGDARRDGFLARILQHEIDHLDGILFPERMTDLRTLTALREFQRFWAEPPAALRRLPPRSGRPAGALFAGQRSAPAGATATRSDIIDSPAVAVCPAPAAPRSAAPCSPA